MNNLIYLDMNIIINYMDYYKKGDYEDIVQKINYVLKNEKITFVYSPAHIEEITVIQRKVSVKKLATKYIKQHFKVISKICDNNELLPTLHEGIVLEKENPELCFKRVKKDYENTTLKAEDLEKDKLKNWKSMQISYDVNDIEGSLLFNDCNLRQEYCNFLKKRFKQNTLLYNSCSRGDLPTYEDIKNNFQMIETLAEFTFDFLDYMGYKNEKKSEKKERHRSRMHDITHGIYATRASMIVTNDCSFKDKLSAFYALYKIPTSIIIQNDFLHICTNKTEESISYPHAAN